MARQQKSHIISDAPGVRETADAPRHLSKQEFGRKLHKMMLAKGFHHAELARRADLPRNNISTYINGRSYPNEQSLLKLAMALDIDANDLLPNRAEVAIRSEQMPDLSVKSSIADPGHAWLTVNRLVPTWAALEVQSVLERARVEMEAKNTHPPPEKTLSNHKL